MELFLSRRLLPLFLTQFLGAFNDNVFKNALVVWITYRLSESSNLPASILVTLAAGIFILPFFLLSATAGELADRFDKAIYIRRVKLAEIGIMLFASVGFMVQTPWVLLTILFCMGTQSAFFGPVKYSILPDLLKREELIGGNALIEAGTFVAILTGTILGGLLILKPVGVPTISILVILFAILGWVASFFIPNTAIASREKKLTLNILAQTWDTMAYAAQKGEVFTIVFGISFFWFLGATYLAQFPTFAKEILYANEEVVTFFLTLFSVGIALGSLYCKVLLKGKIKSTHVPMGAMGMLAGSILIFIASHFVEPYPSRELIGFWSFIQAPYHQLISIALFSVAFFGGLYTVPLYTLLQVKVAKNHRSRVIAANNVLNALLMVLSAFMTLILLKFSFKVTDVFLFVGLLNIPIAFMLQKRV